MELQFEKQPMGCLHRLCHRVIKTEQVGDVRLPEEMADIESIIGAYGQVILRGKSWHSGGMSVSGGVMVWVLYTAEDGSVQQAEAWLPFNLQWDFPDPGKDGQICAWGYVTAMDARAASARKIVLRADLSVCGMAFAEKDTNLPQMGEVPEDVQVLVRTYPMRLLSEAGEAGFTLDEELSLPDGVKLMRCSINPLLREQKVMGDKVAFRGVAQLHILYADGAGQLRTQDFELPFSQYGELSRYYDDDAQAVVIPAITAMEGVLSDGKLLFKCGITCQYLISRRQAVTLPEDGYSTQRKSVPQLEELRLPAILQEQVLALSPQAAVECPGEIIDVQCSPDYRCQVLYREAEGKYRCAAGRWEDAPEDADCLRYGYVTEGGQVIPSPDGAQCRWQMELFAQYMGNEGMQVLTGLTLGEEMVYAEDRPSVILCRAGEEGLWETAKTLNTTVQSIKDANNLTQEPLPGQMLLIPIA